MALGGSEALKKNAQEVRDPDGRLVVVTAGAPGAAASAVDVTDRAGRQLGVLAENAGAGVGAAADAEAAGNGSLIAIVKRLRTLLAGGLPAALTGAGSLKVAIVEAITQANALFIRPRKLITYRAVFRLAARPYAISKAAGAASRSQYATLHHLAASAKDVRLRHCYVAVESASAAAIITTDLVRITTAPATGNPAVTPRALDGADAAADSTALTIPTTGGTEGGGVLATHEWNLGITGAASVANPPPGLNWLDLCELAPERDDEAKQFLIRAGVLEGFAVVVDNDNAATIKLLVIMEFTEE